MPSGTARTTFLAAPLAPPLAGIVGGAYLRLEPPPLRAKLTCAPCPATRAADAADEHVHHLLRQGRPGVGDGMHVIMGFWSTQSHSEGAASSILVMPTAACRAARRRAAPVVVSRDSAALPGTLLQPCVYGEIGQTRR